MIELRSVNTFTDRVLRKLRDLEPVATLLECKVRGGTATLGINDQGEWVPLLRLAQPSQSFNVMSLDVRHHERWEPTFTRGDPGAIADALVGPLRFTWHLQVVDAETEKRTSDHEH